MQQELLESILKERNVKVLCKVLFNYEITKNQEIIVRTIAFAEHKRVLINAMTRYGKTFCVAMGLLIYIVINEDKKCALVAPTNEQAKILRDYLADMIAASNLLSNLIDISKAGLDRLKTESSRRRQTFKNGCEYCVYSAEGKGTRLMGHGINGILIVDEACLIPPEAEAKIQRMLGDDPDNTVLVKLANPWDRATRYYKDWCNPSYFKIHIDWKIAIEEGRTTIAYIEEQRSIMTPLEFTVLYESNFPSQSEDALFDYDQVMSAIDKFHDIERVDSILGADIADKGMDNTVIFPCTCDSYRYEVKYPFSEAKSENTAVAGRLVNMQDQYSATIMNIDSIGVGVGVVSMVRQNLKNQKCRLTACNFGSAAADNKRFLNKKAENYMRLRSLFANGLISIPNHPVLIEQLLAMKWEFSDAGKIRIIDPEEYSPDFADALVYTTWKVGTGGYYMA